VRGKWRTLTSAKDWQELLKELLVETDVENLQDRAFQLENAIFVRSRELEQFGGTETERIALGAAQRELFRVKIEKLGYPDSKFPGSFGSTGEPK
jgi:hypothetical protein